MSPMSPQMSTMMYMGNSMFILIPHYLIPFQVQNPNSTPLHNRDDPTSNLFNVVLPGFDYLPFTLVLLMSSMMGYSVAVLVLMFIAVAVGGSNESESSEEITE
jgi:hypothetical protein